MAGCYNSYYKLLFDSRHLTKRYVLAIVVPLELLCSLSDGVDNFHSNAPVLDSIDGKLLHPHLHSKVAHLHKGSCSLQCHWTAFATKYNDKALIFDRSHSVITGTCT